MQRVWPMIAVSDVRRSSSWYQELLCASQALPESTDFDQVLSTDGEVLLCLHRVAPSDPSGGHRWRAFQGATPSSPSGMMLWFVVNDFEAAWERAQALRVPVDEPPNINNGTGLRAFVVRDPDGYFVAVNESGA